MYNALVKPYRVKEKIVFIPISKKGNAKECSIYPTTALSYTLVN